jgi:hypothetical protein
MNIQDISKDLLASVSSIIEKKNVKEVDEPKAKGEKDFKDLHTKDLEVYSEKLDPKAEASEWIEDFIKSDAPQFKGKSKEERKEMALAAYYSARKKAGLKEGAEAYQKFFQGMLKKFGVKSPAELSGDKKKEFFSAIDSGWKGDDEKKESIEEEISLDEGMKYVNKTTGKDITKHIIDLLSGKIDKKQFEKLVGVTPKKESIDEAYTPKTLPYRIIDMEGPKAQLKIVKHVKRKSGNNSKDIYFDGDDFVIGSKTAVAGALKSGSKVIIQDLIDAAKAAMESLEESNDDMYRWPDVNKALMKVMPAPDIARVAGKLKNKMDGDKVRWGDINSVLTSLKPAQIMTVLSGLRKKAIKEETHEELTVLENSQKSIFESEDINEAPTAKQITDIIKKYFENAAPNDKPMMIFAVGAGIDKAWRNEGKPNDGTIEVIRALEKAFSVAVDVWGK